MTVTVPALTGVDEGLNFCFRIGTSFLAEFALSYTPADVLPELVQNEYDADGTERVIEFDSDDLVVRGNGDPIDSCGWRRLAVMLGTGHIESERHRIKELRPGMV